VKSWLARLARVLEALEPLGTLETASFDRCLSTDVPKVPKGPIVPKPPPAPREAKSPKIQSFFPLLKKKYPNPLGCLKNIFTFVGKTN
jgi:hypothetical protein